MRGGGVAEITFFLFFIFCDILVPVVPAQAGFDKNTCTVHQGKAERNFGSYSFFVNSATL